MNAIPPASVGVLNANLAELLDRVEQGEEIVLTRQGKPVARLVPEVSADAAAASAVLERLFAHADEMAREGARFSHAELMAMRDEGRR